MPERLQPLKEYALNDEVLEIREKYKIVDDHEHVVDIESPEIKEKIEAARIEFQNFYAEFGEKMNLGDEKSIEEVLAAAQEKQIWDKAAKVRELLYGNNISVYGVCYLSGECSQNCEFCPMGKSNQGYQSQLREKSRINRAIRDGVQTPDDLELLEEINKEIAHFKDVKLKELTLDEAKKDLDALVEVGHEEICVLSGEVAKDMDKLMDYMEIAATRPGVKELIFNIGSLSEDNLQLIGERITKIKEGGAENVKFQFRIFQETYDKDTYDRYMRKAPDIKTGKKNFQFRLEAQERALKSGVFDEVGIGALFGLSSNPLMEIKGLKEHAERIKEVCGKDPKRCCLPFGNEPENSGVEIDYKIPGSKYSKKVTKLIYALARLAMPTVSIVSSERDEADMLEELDPVANHTTLFVHAYSNGNTDSLKELIEKKKEEKETAVAQAKTHGRHPDDALSSWEKRGYKPLGFNVEKYDKYRERLVQELPIWYVENQPKNEDEAFMAERDGLLRVQEGRIMQVQKNTRKRPYHIREMNASDLRKETVMAYMTETGLPLPELIVIRNDKKNYVQELPENLIANVRGRVKGALKEIDLLDEEQQVQPVIVAICDNQELRQQYESQGADIILSSMQTYFVNEFAQMTARIKHEIRNMSNEEAIAKKKEIIRETLKKEGL